MKITFNIIVILVLGFNGLTRLFLGNEITGVLWLILATLYQILVILAEKL